MSGPSDGNHFISFITFISMLGFALGVAALITVLSVMNGFERELRTQILGMASHATIRPLTGALSDWEPSRRDRGGASRSGGRCALRPGSGDAESRGRGAWSGDTRGTAPPRTASVGDRGVPGGRGSGGLAGGAIRHAARPRTRESPARHRRLQGGGHRSPGHRVAGRNPAPHAAFHRNRHLRGQPLPVRHGRCGGSPGRRRSPLSARSRGERVAHQGRRHPGSAPTQPGNRNLSTGGRTGSATGRATTGTSSGPSKRRGW